MQAGINNQVFSYTFSSSSMLFLTFFLIHTLSIVSFPEVSADFTRGLQDVEGQEGQGVELECTLSKPDVKVKWLKNKKPLTPSDRIKIVCDRYRHFLQIMDTIPEDDGEYTVVLPNEKESSAKLKIYGKKSQSTCFNIEYRYINQFYHCTCAFHLYFDMQMFT